MAQSNTAARAWARGGTVLAATVLSIAGLFQILLAVVAWARHGTYFVTNSNYVYTFNTAAWGWVHMAIGVVAFLAGLALLTGALWARIVGVALCVIAAVANFLFLPYAPVWSILIIGLSVYAIWAIATNGGRAGMSGQGDESMAGYYPDERYQQYPARAGATGAYATGEIDSRTGEPVMAGAPGRPGEYEPLTGERWPTSNPTTGRHWAQTNMRNDAGEPAGGQTGSNQQSGEPAMAQRGRGNGQGQSGNNQGGGRSSR
jgi:hypothetical protein